MGSVQVVTGLSWQPSCAPEHTYRSFRLDGTTAVLSSTTNHPTRIFRHLRTFHTASPTRTSATFRIVRESTPSVGDTVNKVGITTGWTSGEVVDTCAQTELPNSDRVLLCQTIVINMEADLGDSGAPVFEITNSPNNDDVELLGILWGAFNADGDPTVTWISPVGNVYLDLGMSDSWDACDPSRGC